MPEEVVYSIIESVVEAAAAASVETYFAVVAYVAAPYPVTCQLRRVNAIRDDGIINEHP